MRKKLETTINQLVAQEQLPAEYAKSIHRYFVPLSQRIATKRLASKVPIVIGINGAQGTGKSTLSVVLSQLLAVENLRTAVISIDDLYLTRAEREQLSRTVHPLLKTRGVPGTHDIVLGQRLIAQLKSAHENTETPIVRFNKAADDRCEPEDWTQHSGAVDIIILEGWCVGARPCDLSGEPMNLLEQEQDSDGKWRQFVQTQLEGDYQALFGRLDMLIMLKAPSMECIVQWRTLQEQKLAQKMGNKALESKNPLNIGATSAPNKGIMSEQELLWFVMHYERLTRIMLDTLPAFADVVYAIDAQHNIVDAQYAVQGAKT